MGIMATRTENKKQPYVQTFGKKKNATAVAICRAGAGTLRINGVPIDLVEPALLRQKVLEPVSLIGMDRFRQYDIRLRVRGGGYTGQIDHRLLPKASRRVHKERDKGNIDGV